MRFGWWSVGSGWGRRGKVSNLVQMLREARYEHVLINDSDILVSPQYLTRVMECFADARRGDGDCSLYWTDSGASAGMTVWSRLEALGISTDFLPGVLAARWLEGGIRFGLGSTLATSEECFGEGGRAGAAGGVSCGRL